jgi:8-oxo-dGTP pyrophosphatase MutT (NUDIX family)
VSRWLIHGERAVYRSDWLELWLVEVELPSGERFEHHVVRLPRPAVATVMRDPERGVLLIHRHRFVADSWSWEIPGGAVDPGEELEEAARRESVEESGWEPGPLRPVGSFLPAIGLCNQVFHVFTSNSARQVGDPVNQDETERVEWMTEERVRELIRSGDIRDGFSLTALLLTLSAGDR